jgi:hypothetical protein
LSQQEQVREQYCCIQKKPRSRTNTLKETQLQSTQSHNINPPLFSHFPTASHHQLNSKQTPHFIDLKVSSAKFPYYILQIQTFSKQELKERRLKMCVIISETWACGHSAGTALDTIRSRARQGQWCRIEYRNITLQQWCDRCRHKLNGAADRIRRRF